jgi:hypothetical protein
LFHRHIVLGCEVAVVLQLSEQCSFPPFLVHY